MPIQLDKSSTKVDVDLDVTTQLQLLDRDGNPIIRGTVIVRWKAGQDGVVHANLGDSTATADGAAAPANMHDFEKDVVGEAAIWLNGRSCALAASKATKVTVDVIQELG